MLCSAANDNSIHNMKNTMSHLPLLCKTTALQLAENVSSMPPVI
jgi:hypothetical protein